MYPTPSELNVTTWTDLLIWANVVTNYWFGNLVLLAIFLIAFITFLFVDKPEKAFAFSSFICVIIAILFRGIGIVGEIPVILGIIFTAIGVLLLKKSE
jgi:hypothetical protein